MRAGLTLAAGLVLAWVCVGEAAGSDEERQGRGDEYRDGYRRGYDDGYASGYRRGLEEGERQAKPAAPPPPRATGPITVSTAYYGTSAHSCDATARLARSANGRRTFSMNVSNDLCGDPAQGERKQLEVTYVCGTIAKTASAYEHRTVTLDCTH